MATTGILIVCNNYQTPTSFAVNNNNIDGLPGGNSNSGTFIMEPNQATSFFMTCTGIEQSWFAIGVQDSGADWVKYNLGEPSGTEFDSSGDGTDFNLFCGNTEIVPGFQSLFSEYPAALFLACFGPGSQGVPQCINSVIGANLPALIAWLQANPTYNAGPVQIQITSIDPNTTINCYYGSLAQTPPTGNNQVSANVMLCVNTALTAILTWGGYSVPVTLTATPVYIQLGGQCTYGPPTGDQIMSANVAMNSVLVSLPGYSLSSPDLTTLEIILAAAMPPLAPAIACVASPSIENFINGPLNSSILSALSTVINNIVSKALQPPPSP